MNVMKWGLENECHEMVSWNGGHEMGVMKWVLWNVGHEMGIMKWGSWNGYHEIGGGGQEMRGL